MKNLGKLALLGAVIAASAQFASASSITGDIDVYGNDSFTATSITVTSPATIGNGTLGTIAPTGSFLTAGLAGTSVTLSSVGSTLPQVILTGLDGLSFTLDSYNIVTQSSTFWNIIGTGTFDLAGYSPTLYDFSFTTTNAGTAGQTVSFVGNAVTAPAPEPSSLMLLGTGLVGAAGTFLRKRIAA